MHFDLLWQLYTLAFFSFFFFNDTATTEIYTLSLHDALPIWPPPGLRGAARDVLSGAPWRVERRPRQQRSEEHTSELQSQSNLVCRLLLEKKKKNTYVYYLSLTHLQTLHRSVSGALCLADDTR